MPIAQLILIQGVTFVALIIGLRALMYRQVNAALKRLQALQEEAQAKQAQLEQELEEARRQRAAEIEQGQQKAAQLVEAAKREAVMVGRNAKEQAKQEYERLLTRGRQDVEKRQSTLAAEIEQQAFRLSTELIRCTFTEAGKEDFQHHVIDELIEDIRRLDKSHFSVSTQSATITSCYPLTDRERQRLQKTLTEKLDTEVTLEAKIDPELLTGLIVQVGSLVIDGSLQNKLRKAIQMIRNNHRTPATITHDPTST